MVACVRRPYDLFNLLGFEMCVSLDLASSDRSGCDGVFRGAAGGKVKLAAV